MLHIHLCVFSIIYIYIKGKHSFILIYPVYSSYYYFMMSQAQN